MHIVSVNYQFPSLSETFVLNQITGLMERGHRVTPWCQSEGDWSNAHADVSKFGLQKQTQVTPSSRSFSTRVVLWFALLAAKPIRALRVLKNWRRIDRRGGREMMCMTLTLGAVRNVDVYHCQFGYMGEMVMWLRNNRLIDPVPVVTSFHGHDIRAALSGEFSYPLLCGATDPVIAISEFSVRHLESFGFPPSRIRRIPVAIEMETFPFTERLARNGEPVQILTVARLVREKNLSLALDAICHCLDQLGTGAVHWTLIGDGVLQPQLQEWIRERGLEKAVTCTGALDQRDVLRYYRDSDLFLLSSAAENLPVSIMEASASGLPVVSTRVGAIEELVVDGETGFLVDPDDAEGMTAGLIRLVGDLALRRRLGANGRAHILKNFDLKPWLERLEECYPFSGQKEGPFQQ